MTALDTLLRAAEAEAVLRGDIELAAKARVEYEAMRRALKLYVDADFYKGGDTQAAYDHNERLASGKFVLYGDPITGEAPNDLHRTALSGEVVERYSVAVKP